MHSEIRYMDAKQSPRCMRQNGSVIDMSENLEGDLLPSPRGPPRSGDRLEEGHRSQPDPPVYILPSCAMPSDKVSLRKFSGYSHEDPERFLSEFESYVTFSGLNFDPSTARKVAAFHIHLAGPALTWFHSLDTSVKGEWRSLLKAFKAQYLVRDHMDPTIMAESAAYHKLKLSPGQPLEDFHAQILEKGKRLDKLERDMLYQFTEGLPPMLPLFVRTGMCTTLKAAFAAAKSAEAAGYRSHGLPMQMVDPHVNATSIAKDSALADIQAQVSELTSIVKNMLPASHTVHSTGAPDQQARVRSFSCFRCQGQNHRKRDCLWTI